MKIYWEKFKTTLNSVEAMQFLFYNQYISIIYWKILHCQMNYTYQKIYNTIEFVDISMSTQCYKICKSYSKRIEKTFIDLLTFSNYQRHFLDVIKCRPPMCKAHYQSKQFYYMETRATIIGYLELEITTFEKIKDFEYKFFFMHIQK